ncbi:HAD family hydrolase [Bacillus hominis]|uniref:HAD family hydrolase n=1 Tax=Bacillus hominis TaxID=2817478 RepID=UPI0025A16B24|nr:HAD family hydrolase [Bacillus hominis]MDM5436373.1 HAD family hydrolase [Bacillus hominis]
MGIQAVFFDLDGTLISHQIQLKNFIGSQFGKYREWFKETDFVEWENEFMRLDANGYVTKDIVYKELAAKFPSIRPFEEKLYADFLDNFHYYISPLENMYIMLYTLKNQGYPLGLITNGGYEIQQKKIDKLSFENIFDVIIISEAVGYEKPAPDIYFLGTQALNVNAENCVFIGNHSQNDVLGSKSVGMKTVWMSNRDTWLSNDFYPDATISKLDELEEVLQAL